MQVTWETRKVLVPKTFPVTQTIYETKLVPIQVANPSNLLFCSEILILINHGQVPRTVVESVVVEVPYRDVQIPVRQVHGFQFSLPRPRIISD